MIYVKIGGEEREIGEAEPQWITQAIVGRRQQGEEVCVRVRFDEPDVKIALATPTCGGGGGGSGPPPNQHEQKLIDLWRKLKLDDADFAPGNVVAFIKQL